MSKAMAAENRELRRQKKQWQDDSDSWKLHSVKQVQEIVDLKLAYERLETYNARLRAALKPIEFCAEARGDHWCPSCNGNKQEGTPTRGHYAHCPIYVALAGEDGKQ